ncbi:MAG TPA: Sjogren's syndrome/scleroderma autoantigen 1 family protein [Nitrososphaeraceae archaeon]|nr:Sjogren's syndrome/scleroderma autoantigen 1 family protein [Nitrososphaeraceae archaeon]
MDSEPNNTNPDRGSDIRDAASFLLKGGSLLGTPCESCNGVQIKYKGKVICINCGKQEMSLEDKTIAATPTSGTRLDRELREPQNLTAPLHSLESEIQERMLELFRNLKTEFNDPNMEKQGIELLEMYLGLLERLKKYSKMMEGQKE